MGAGDPGSLFGSHVAVWMHGSTVLGDSVEAGAHVGFYPPPPHLPLPQGNVRHQPEPTSVLLDSCVLSQYRHQLLSRSE